MRVPGFSAEASLGRSLRRYRAQISFGSVGSGSVQAQAACYCSEPDIRRVCTSTGQCHNEKVCLQWVCPSRGSTVDEDSLGDFFGLN
jgi:hypothetical protein